MSDHGTDLVRLGSEIVKDPRVQHTITSTLGAPAREAGAWLTDQIRYRRFKAQVKIWTRATEQLAEAGVEPGEVDLSVLVPLLESGSLQEDESMVDRWAALLAAAATKPDGVPPSYPEILRQLTPREADMLDRLYDEAGATWMECRFDWEVLAERAGFPVDRFLLATENLLRLRLLKNASSLIFAEEKVMGYHDVLLTALGHDFVSVCRPPSR